VLKYGVGSDLDHDASSLPRSPAASAILYAGASKLQAHNDQALEIRM
jgi:hypothetical protein